MIPETGLQSELCVGDDNKQQWHGVVEHKGVNPASSYTLVKDIFQLIGLH